MARVVDRDLGWAATRRQLHRTKATRRVHVGVQGDEALEPKEDGATTNVLVAATNEFGSEDGHVPERSSIRATIDEKAESYRKLCKQLGLAVIERRMTPTQALGLFGERVVADMRAKIRSGVAPANAPSTIEQKGSSKPLIDTGQFVQSITYKVQ